MSPTVLLALNAIGVVMVIIISILLQIAVHNIQGKLEFKRLIESKTECKIRYRDIH